MNNNHIYKKKPTDKYMVPNTYLKNNISFTFHATWKEAYKYAKQRKVQLLRIHDDYFTDKTEGEKLFRSLIPFYIH